MNRFVWFVLSVVVASVCSVQAVNVDQLLFVETFDTDPFVAGKWIKSTDPKYVDDDSAGSIKIAPSTIPAKGLESDNGLRLTKEHKHYGFGALLKSPLSLKDNSELVFQYELKLEEQLNCGGAYIKLLRETPDFDLSKLNGETPYSIMFGPDKCGTNNKIHFIFPHQNPHTSEWEEKHLNETGAIKGDKKTHLYTLSVQDDNTFSVYIDKVLSKRGSLLTHMKPPVNPPAMIDDPTDSKPADWVDQAEIVDPSASKPDDWDESAPRMIPKPDAVKPENWLDDGPQKVSDPNAVKPEDWDDEQDGEWEAPLIDNPDCEKYGCGEWKAPMIKNPAYKGVWKAPKIKNPEYKGPWKARQIPNPNYFEDLTPAKGMTPIVALAVEVWTINAGLHFDNFIIARSLADAWSFADETFGVKQKSEGAKEKKEKKEKAKSARDEMKKTGKIQDKFTAFVFELTEFVEDALETNFAAVVGTAIGAVLFIVAMCWPSKKSASSRARREPPASAEKEVPSQTTDESKPSSSEDSSATASGSTETSASPSDEATK